MIQPRKAVKKMKPYNPPIEGRKKYSRFDFNENTLGTSDKVLDAIRNVKKEDICSYPEYTSFRKKLARFMDIRPEELVIANAGDEAIKLVVDTYVDEGDEIIIPVPTFPMFRFYGELAGAKITEILYSKDLSFPVDEVLAKISGRTKIVVMVNPNNPTGTSVARDDIEKIIKKAKNSVVLLDEAYAQFSGESCLDLIKRYDNLVILNSFSKAYGLGGLRVGFLMTDKRNASNLMKASSPYSVNSIAVIAASAAIDDNEFVENYVDEINESKKYVIKELDRLKLRYYPTKANFVLVDFGKKNDEIVRRLRKKGILVRNQTEKPLLENCTRITIGTRKQMQKLLRELKEVI